MKNMNNEELANVNGGAIKASAIGIIGGVVSFVIGFLSGYTRPSTCKSGK